MIHIKIQGTLLNFLRNHIEKCLLEKIDNSYQEKRGIGVNYFVSLSEEESSTLEKSIKKAEECCQQKLKNKKMNMTERQALHYILRKIEELEVSIKKQKNPLLV